MLYLETEKTEPSLKLKTYRLKSKLNKTKTELMLSKNKFIVYSFFLVIKGLF